MKRTAAALAVLIGALALTACGSQDAPETQPVAVQTEAAVPQAVETSEAAPEIVTVPVGASQPVAHGTMRVSRVDGSTAIIEVSTSAPVTFDGTFTATDSTGVEYVGTPALENPAANGIGGWPVTFDAPEIASVTYQEQGQAPLTWTAG